MHIVQICQRFYYGHGQEIHVYNLSNELARLGHKITIVTSDINASDIFKKDLKLHENINIMISKAIKIKYPTNQLLFPNLGEELLQMNNVDIIHAHGAMCYSSLVGLTIAKTKKIPFVFTPHFHPWRFFEQRPYRYIREAYEKTFTIPIMRESSAVIAVSPFEKNYLVVRRKLSQEKIHVVANGINAFYYPSVVSRRAVRQHHDIPENKRYLIAFGTKTDPRKGVDRTLQVFDLINKKIPETQLIIVGWKYKKKADHIANLMDALPCKKNVTTLGYVSEDEKVALIKMSDVLISPTSYEAFGIILGEAMMLKVPVVVTRVGGTPFIVRHRKTGLTVGRYNSINKFAQYTLELLRDNKLRERMGEEGKRLVKKYFTWKKITKDVNRVYLSVLKKQ
ncbi:MAG: glycosyltransferase family 4 protein [Candidatus Beckwithbacteria bacterium]|nr:glycosyltransferase family 4 protein [Candidatus Beckwithbacteria bacterium]